MRDLARRLNEVRSKDQQGADAEWRRRYAELRALIDEHVGTERELVTEQLSGALDAAELARLGDLFTRELGRSFDDGDDRLRAGAGREAHAPS
jgi:hypothetical protein